MEDLRFYIVVRTDVEFSKGKMMVHTGHLCSKMASDVLFETHKEYEDYLDQFERYTNWYGDGTTQTKIVLKEFGLEDIMYWYAKAIENHFLAYCIEDAGFYEVEKGTVLMVGIGPISKDEAREIGLDKLKLYK